MYNRWADPTESSAIDAIFLDADIAFDEDDDEALSLALERSVSTTSVSTVLDPAEELRRINNSLEVHGFDVILDMTREGLMKPFSALVDKLHEDIAAEALVAERLVHLKLELTEATAIKNKEAARASGVARERDSLVAKQKQNETANKDCISKLTRERDNCKREVQNKTQSEAKTEADLRKLEIEAQKLRSRLQAQLQSDAKGRAGREKSQPMNSGMPGRDRSRPMTAGATGRDRSRPTTAGATIRIVANASQPTAASTPKRNMSTEAKAARLHVSQELQAETTYLLEFAAHARERLGNLNLACVAPVVPSVPQEVPMPTAPAEVARKVVTPTRVEFTANSRGVSTEDLSSEYEAIMEQLSPQLSPHQAPFSPPTSPL